MNTFAVADPEQLRTRAPRRRLTVADHHRMGDTGILHEDDGVELIDGKLFQMAEIGTPHMSIVIQLTSRFGALAADRFLISAQNSIEIRPFSEPQPDLVLLRPRADAYWGAHRTVTVFRDPSGEGYRLSVEVCEGAVSPSCCPDIAIRLDDLFG